MIRNNNFLLFLLLHLKLQLKMTEFSHLIIFFFALMAISCSEVEEQIEQEEIDLTSSGSGEFGDPYIIDSATEFLRMGTGRLNWDLDCHYKLAANITLKSEFTALGSESEPFTGVIDGDNYTVTGLTINKSTQSYQALIGYMGAGAEVRNLHLRDVNVLGNKYIGSFVGYNDGGTVTFCSASGYVEGTGDYQSQENEGGNVGGLIGNNNVGTLTNSYNLCSVKGVATGVGGLVGKSYHATVENCYNKGEVYGRMNYVAGLVGYNSSAYSTIRSCYTVGEITAGTILTCGALYGYNNLYGTVEYCYALEGSADMLTAEGQGSAINSSFVGEEDMKSREFIADLNSSAWAYDSLMVNGGYPILVQ